jgi:hypothetical protein
MKVKIKENGVVRIEEVESVERFYCTLTNRVRNRVYIDGWEFVSMFGLLFVRSPIDTLHRAC